MIRSITAVNPVAVGHMIRLPGAYPRVCDVHHKKALLPPASPNWRIEQRLRVINAARVSLQWKEPISALRYPTANLKNAFL
jgi:hypothetical protein